MIHSWVPPFMETPIWLYNRFIICLCYSKSVGGNHLEKGDTNDESDSPMVFFSTSTMVSGGVLNMKGEKT